MDVVRGLFGLFLVAAVVLCIVAPSVVLLGLLAVLLCGAAWGLGLLAGGALCAAWEGLASVLRGGPLDMARRRLWDALCASGMGRAVASLYADRHRLARKGAGAAALWIFAASVIFLLLAFTHMMLMEVVTSIAGESVAETYREVMAVPSLILPILGATVYLYLECNRDGEGDE